MPKVTKEKSPPPESGRTPMGNAPKYIKRIDNRFFQQPNLNKQNPWCPKVDIEFDPWCDAENPKTILYKDITKAAAAIKEKTTKTPLVRSRCCVQFKMEINYKLETIHRTGSFSERGALYSLLMLSEEQRKIGVITASTGNWAMALSYQGQKLNVSVTVVLPVNTLLSTVENCQDFGATVILYGDNFAEAKLQAFTILAENGFQYINGYDHPHVIAGSGTIGLEILEQLPQTDAILIPVGGGGLIAGIAAAVKYIKPNISIYGIEPSKCCSFFKAMENERPYQTVVGRSLAEALAVPTAGYNAFYTARSLVDKMVLIDDDWITRAILHLVEEEKWVVDGAGASALGALLAVPNILPELCGKTVVCVITGGNIDVVTLPRCLERAKALDGRIIKITATLPADDTKIQLKLLSMIANVGCNVIQCDTEHAWLVENEFYTVFLTLVCEARDLEHACTLKRVMERLFPNICDFLEEPFSPIPICTCFPKRHI